METDRFTGRLVTEPNFHQMVRHHSHNVNLTNTGTVTVRVKRPLRENSIELYLLQVPVGVGTYVIVSNRDATESSVLPDMCEDRLSET